MSFQQKASAIAATTAAGGVAAVRQYGVSPVISAKGPTPDDLIASQQLESVLRGRNLFSSDEESEALENAIGTLNEILQAWMHEESRALGMTDESHTGDIGKICVFGSFRLGVHGRGADMDTLVVGPHFITRAMFFDKFVKRLEERTDVVTELTARVDAYVPVVTFKFNNIEFDLLYAQMSASIGNTIGSSSFNIYDDHVLRGLDPKSILSLNGPRVTDMILSLMPEESITNFRMALKFIKLWAKVRGIYSNVFGYLGGVSWAILVAYVCQLYPLAAPNKILEKFFQLYQQWKWPFPIFLNEPKYDSPLGLTVWNPKENYRDGHDLMPVITPAYPCMCSTHNVSKATLKVLQSEFLRGHEMFEELQAKLKRNEKIADPCSIWSDLLSDASFFFDFKDYLDIKISSRKEEDQLMWLGYVESKIRQLIMPLARMDGCRTVPFPKSYTDPNATYLAQESVTNEDGSVTTTTKQEKLYVDHFFVGLDFDLAKFQPKSNIPVSTTAGTAAATTAAAAASSPINISDAVLTFRSFVFDLFSIKDPERSQRGFNCDVIHIKSKQLPDFVFKDEKRPAGWGKKGGKKRAASASVAALPAAASDPAAAAAAATPAHAQVKMEDTSSTSSLSSTVKLEPTETAHTEEPSAKRTKLEPDTSAAAASSSSLSSSATPSIVKMETDIPDVVKPVPSSSPDASPDSLVKDEPMPLVSTTDIKTEPGTTRSVHEMETALPTEPVVATNKEGGDVETMDTTTAPTATNAAASSTDVKSAAGFIAAESVVTHTETESAIQLVSKKPQARSMVAIKIGSVAHATNKPTTATNTSTAAPTASSSTSNLSPPILATSSQLSSSTSSSLPTSSPLLVRPGSFIKPVIAPVQGASRIRTYDDLADEEKQNNNVPQQQNNHQQHHQHQQQQMQNQRAHQQQQQAMFPNQQMMMNHQHPNMQMMHPQQQQQYHPQMQYNNMMPMQPYQMQQQMPMQNMNPYEMQQYQQQQMMQQQMQQQMMRQMQMQQQQQQQGYGY